ncbi:MAG: hypothetical protein IPL77_10820 [Flavobacteriales bacterium]|nr:hypothetical protein [Flavobacteriales bacterium]
MSTDSRIHAIALAASSAAPEVAPRVTTGGASAAALGWVLSNEVLGVIGVLIALAGWLTTWYYRRRDDRRAEQFHRVKLRRLQAGLDTDVAPLDGG